jgi:hypothetical protein
MVYLPFGFGAAKGDVMLGRECCGRLVLAAVFRPDYPLA